MDAQRVTDHPFVRGLEPSQLAGLAACARETAYHEGAFVFREGEPADALYLLRGGCVALEQDVPGRGVVTVETLCSGDILGLSWLFPASRWTLDARCIEPVEALALDAACLRECMRADRELANQLMAGVVAALYERLVRVRLQRLDVYKAGE